MLKQKKTFFLDVRTYTELLNGYVEGFIQINFSDLEKKLNEEPNFIPKHNKIVVICSNGLRS